MPDRSLTCSRAGALPCPPNPPGFIDLTKSSAPCRARQIMAGLEGLRVGNAAVGSREALIARLEQTASSGVNMNSCASGLGLQ